MNNILEYNEFLNEGRYDFNKPNAKTLSHIDSYMQEHDERNWDRSGVPDLYQGNEGWEYVEKRHPKDFLTAWHKAMAFIHEHGHDIKKIENY